MKNLLLFFEIMLLSICQGALYAQISATGGIITTDGAYKIHTFSTVGTDTFKVLSGSDAVRYLVVAGGGAGYSGANNGGAGAGGMLDNGDTLYNVSTGNYTIVLGAGGNGSAATRIEKMGGNSVFDTIIAHGGGVPTSGATAYPESNGGSGGGSSGHSNAGCPGPTCIVYPAGLGISGEGNNGGAGRIGSSTTARSGGGGGGAGTVGALGTAGGAGGDGLQSNITGTTIYYAGGGGASHLTNIPSTVSSAGGLGGGGGNNNIVSGLSGTDGLGGGGASGTSAGNGGSGVVIIRYLDGGSANTFAVQASSTKLSFYPNPFDKTLYVNSGTTVNALFRIVNVLGQEVYSQHIIIRGDNTSVAINLPLLANGIYVVFINDTDNSTLLMNTKVVRAGVWD
ncbi:MAG: T9SS type A sorting domain-containing protein [Bacteroidetes bacterium]|nr:T9SS type A sorting domain-containing protein [Bacteroidota bacterium]